LGSLDIAMQQSTFNSLITPPWPAKDKQSNDDDQPTRNEQDDLTNFERNDQSEGYLDNIAILGYN
jgi:hypothetical protein